MLERNIDLLDINLIQMKKKIEKESRFEDTLFDYSIDDMKALLNEAIEIEAEETEDAKTRGIVKKKNGTGKYISIKNVHISMKIILEGLALKKDMTPISIVIFLYNLFEQLRLNISRWQMSVYMSLYEVRRTINITDENLVDVIISNIGKYGYEKLSTGKIMNTVNELYNMGLLDIDNGSYKVEEKVYY